MAWATAAALTTAAEQVDDGLRLVGRTEQELVGRPFWQGAAADQLAGALKVNVDSLSATVAALREASGVMGAFARRCALAEIDLLGGQATSGDVESSAARTAAAELDRVARRAPAPRASGGTEAVPAARVGDAMSPQTLLAEVKLGGFESLAQTGAAGLGAARYLRSFVGDPLEHRDDLADGAKAVWQVVQHPRQLASDLLDLETWKTNPARATGHLLPDVVLALTAGGGAVVVARTLGTRASERVLVTRELRAEGALASRKRLIERAAQHDLRGPARLETGWDGGKGLQLTREQDEVVERYWKASRAVQRRLRREMNQLAEDVGGYLAGEEHAVKELDSLERKIATRLGAEEAARGGSGGGLDLLGILDDQSDTVRFCVVLPEKSYIASAHKMAALLDRSAVAPSHWANKWDSGRYRGINTSWTDATSGARFEIQLHTPASYSAGRRTRLAFEEWRLPETQANPARRVLLERRIAEEFEYARLPEGVLELTPVTMVPPELRGLAATPPVLGGALIGGGVVLTERPPTRAVPRGLR